LQTITFPSQLQTIEMYAFEGCSALEKVEIPATCTTIGDFVFEGCSALQEIQVADDNESYQDKDGVLFSGDGTTLIKYPDASAITDYVVPDGCTRLEDWSFTGATELKSIDMQQITELGEDVFFYCQSLEQVTVPDAITELPNNTFAYCTSLTAVTLPEHLTSIGDYAFYTCVRLPDISIPDTVTSIGEQAFYNCLELKNLTLPASLKELGSAAFGLYAESQDDTPSVVTNFSVTYHKNSTVAKYVKQYGITAEVLEGSGGVNGVLIGVIIGVVVVAAGVIILIVVCKKKKKTESGKGEKA
jgi:hypothetical protein